MTFYLLLLLLVHQCPRFAVGQEEPPDERKVEEERLIPAELTVTSWNDMPFSGLVKENGKWIGKGHAFYLLDLISSKLNFTYSVIPPNEHVLGNEKTGILGMLYEKKVDIAVAFLPALPEMRRFCSFSTALDETRLTALMRRPQESATGSGLLAPFDTTVWLLVLTSLIFVGPLIYFFAFIRGKLWNQPDSENYSLPSCFWFVYSSLLKQGTNIVATTDSTRMLFATWWIFILILTSFYTANLTAFLTKPQFTLNINSLDDIVDKGYSWITYKGRTVEFLLSQRNANELSPLNITVRRGSGIFKYKEPSKAILKSVSTKKLFLAEAHYLQTLIFADYLNKTHNQLEHSLRCTYVIMPGSILVSNRAFAFPLGSKIEQLINKELLKLVEAGIIQHTREKDLPLAEICPVDLRSSERQLRNADLLLTYKVVAVGYAIAALIFLIEVGLALTVGRIRHESTMELNQKPHRIISKETFSPRDLFSRSLKTNIIVTKPNPVNGFTHGGDNGCTSGSAMDDDQNGAAQLKRESFINGRNYYVIVDGDGDKRLIPIRTPSAFLFQYAA